MKRSFLSIAILITAWCGVIATKQDREDFGSLNDQIASKTGKRWKVSQVFIENDPANPDTCLANMELIFFRNLTNNENVVQTDSSRKKCNPNLKNKSLQWEPINYHSIRIKEDSIYRNIHLYANFKDSLILFDTSALGVVKYMYLKAL
jgi:hypothetical protein